jgi:hypothetical protein
VIRRFDAARDTESLRECVVDQQNFIATSSRRGRTAVRSRTIAYLEAEWASVIGCSLMAHCADEDS